MHVPGAPLQAAARARAVIPSAEARAEKKKKRPAKKRATGARGTHSGRPEGWRARGSAASPGVAVVPLLRLPVEIFYGLTWVLRIFPLARVMVQ